MNSLYKTPVWAENAKVKMKSINVLQKDLIEMFGVTTTYAIGNYFNGRREPSTSSLLKLADFLDMSLDDLFLTEEQFDAKQKFKAEDYLMDALKILTRLKSLSDKETICLLNAVDKIGTKDIIKTANALADHHKKGDSRTEAVLDVSEYMAKAS